MKFFLIDGHALFYRAYFAFIKNPLTNSSGMNISAVFGFANSILKLIREQKPDYFGVAFDHRQPTFRHLLYKEYKAHRDAMPDDLIPQIPLMYEFVKALGVREVTRPGFEADDVIGTLSKASAREGIECFIVTGDKDMLQLIDDQIHIFNIRAISKPEEPMLLDPEYVKDKYGIPYTSIVDYLSLLGDNSDNVPGISGVGNKTAVKLLRQYNTLDNLYAHIDRIEPKTLRKKIIDGKESAYLSKTLVTIKTDVPIEIATQDFKLSPSFPPSLGEWIVKNGFTSLLKYLDQDILDIQVKDKVVVPAPVADMRTLSLFHEWEEYFYEHKGIIVLLYEASSQILTGNISIEKSVCIRLNEFSEKDRKTWGEWIEKNRSHLAGFDVKNLLHVFLTQGVKIGGGFFDLQLAGFLLDPEHRNPSLKDLAEKYLQSSGIQIREDLLSKGDAESLGYKGFLAFSLYEQLADKIRQEGMKELFDKIEIPMVYVLAVMETNGIQIDVDFLKEYRIQLEEELNSLKKTITGYAGEEFNVNSTKQLGEILFEKLEIQNDSGVKKVKKTKTGYSTASETMEQYKHLPIIGALLRYRILEKLRSTYVESLIDLAHEKTGRIHAVFNQMIAVTGRLSSQNPNLQNIPIRQSDGAKIREAFMAATGYSLVSADYSQIELRILAHLSMDPLMTEAFEKNRDIHAETASHVFNVPLNKVTPDQRSRAKAVNFGVVYGMGPFKLSQDTGMSMHEAQAFIEQYFSIYSGVKAYIDHEIKKVKATEKTRNLFGRIRHLPKINSVRRDEQILAEHMAVNTPIQGSAADLIKCAMIRIQKKIDAEHLQSRLLIQVHDELLFEVPDSELKQMKQYITHEMENALLLRVPLKINIGVGRTWLEAHS